MMVGPGGGGGVGGDVKPVSARHWLMGCGIRGGES